MGVVEGVTAVIADLKNRGIVVILIDSTEITAMIPDHFILLPHSGAATRGEAEDVGVEVRKVRERPRFVVISDLSGTHEACIMKAGLVSTGQPDIVGLRPWIKIQGALRTILEAQPEPA